MYSLFQKKRTLLKSYLGFTQFSSEHLLATLGHEDDGDLVCVVLRVLRSQLKNYLRMLT